MAADNRFYCILALMIVLVSGCATSGSIAPKSDDAVVPEVTKPARPARLRIASEYDFTIEESIRVPGAVRDAYNAALRLLTADQLVAGIAAMQAVIDSAPELTTPYVDLGIAYINQGSWVEAEKALQHALLLTPRHPVAANELGVVYRRTGRYELARQSFTSALDSFPNYHYAQLNLGVLCDLFLLDTECALKNYSAYQQAFPDNKSVRIWIADITVRSSQTAKLEEQTND